MKNLNEVNNIIDYIDIQLNDLRIKLNNTLSTNKRNKLVYKIRSLMSEKEYFIKMKEILNKSEDK